MSSKLFSTSPILKHSLATPLTNILFNSELAIENINRQTTYCAKSELNRVMLNAKYMKSLLLIQEERNNYIFSPQKAVLELIKLNDGAKIKTGLVSRIALPVKKYLQGNKLLFQEILVCLINNAYESYNQKIKHKMVFLSVLEKRNNCLISIVDAGKGMNWWEKNLASMPFHSQKNKHSGLGLYFAKYTIEKNFNGKISIKSRKNKGTTISLSIPFYKG
jgi:K+-sensing histidine kinase KdpD